MPDLKDRIAAWIETQALPVGVSEAVERSRRRSAGRGWVWALAGALLVVAAVAAPSLLLGSRVGPSSTGVSVPDWVGLRIERVREEAARAGIELTEEPVQIGGEPGVVVRQSPAPGSALPPDGEVVVGVARPPGATIAPSEQTAVCEVTTPPPEPGVRYVNVYFPCRGIIEAQVQPLLRTVPEDTENFELAAYRALSAGPEGSEAQVGFRFLPVVVRSVTVEDGRVVVDLDPGAAPTAGDVNALFATGFQFETTASVEIRIDGNCASFSDWAGVSCVRSADDWWQAAAKELIATWPRVLSRPEPVTGDCRAPTVEPGPGETTVTVLFECTTGAGEGFGLAPVYRVVPVGLDPLTATLRELVKGPSGSELAAGFRSAFSEQTARALIGVEAAGGRVVVDFQRFVRSPAISNITTSYGGLAFNTVLNANLFQYPQVEEVEYRVDGSCDAYWNAFEATCSIQTRAGFERASSELP